MKSVIFHIEINKEDFAPIKCETSLGSSHLENVELDPWNTMHMFA